MKDFITCSITASNEYTQKIAVKNIVSIEPNGESWTRINFVGGTTTDVHHTEAEVIAMMEAKV